MFAELLDWLPTALVLIVAVWTFYLLWDGEI
jgi:hypothetical protein